MCVPLDTGSLEEGRQKIVTQNCRIHCFSVIDIYYKELKHCYQEDMTLNINSLQPKTCETLLFAFVDEINLNIFECKTTLYQMFERECENLDTIMTFCFFCTDSRARAPVPV